MIEIPFSPTRDKRPITDKPQCIICNKPITTARRWMFWSTYGAYAVTEAEYDATPENAQTGMYEVGAECLRRHPELKPYAVRC